VGKSWQTQDRFLELRSSWVTLIREYLDDDWGQTLEYWRVEKAASIEPLAITKLTSLNIEGWAVNSSFSNQEVWRLVIEIASKFTIDFQLISGVYPSNRTGVNQLLQDISCLQCRSVILEWWHQQNN
jgi:hypothetical protein